MAGLLDQLLMHMLQQQYNPQLTGILGEFGVPLTMTDESSYGILPGQQYAGGKPYNPLTGFNMLIPDPNQLVGSVGGPVTAGARMPKMKGSTTKKTAAEREVDQAFEQMRMQNQGLTREQRREKMLEESKKEFEQGANMSDAEWDALVKASGLAPRDR